MRKDCDTCIHDEFGDGCCDNCYWGKDGNPPTHWEPTAYYKPDTNADTIREMTDEELAEFLMSSWFADNICKNCEGEYDRCGDFAFCANEILKWLKK